MLMANVSHHAQLPWVFASEYLFYQLCTGVTNKQTQTNETQYNTINKIKKHIQKEKAKQSKTKSNKL